MVPVEGRPMEGALFHGFETHSLPPASFHGTWSNGKRLIQQCSGFGPFLHAPYTMEVGMRQTTAPWSSVIMFWNTCAGIHLAVILIRCPNHLKLLPLMWTNSESTLSLSWMSDFGGFYSQSDSFGHYPQLMNISEGWKVDLLPNYSRGLCWWGPLVPLRIPQKKLVLGASSKVRFRKPSKRSHQETMLITLTGVTRTLP